MPDRVQAALDRHKIAAKAALASPGTAVPTVDIKALRAAEKAARLATAAMSAEIDTVNERISELIARQREHQGTRWRRWFPAPEIATAPDALRAHRERLRSSQSALAQARLRAEIAARDGASRNVRLDAMAAQERQAATKLIDTKLAILARARALLARIPALAYVGVRNLLKMAARIESAREQGYDPGPLSNASRPTIESNP